MVVTVESSESDQPPTPAGNVSLSEQSKTGAVSVAQPLLVLAGNPNVGKSAIFNALTGLHADVSNYPGTTIDVSRGHLGENQLVDTPGIYGVSSFNDEERIARDYIVDANLVINVASALSLDRDLFLTLQLIDLGKPLLLVLNQWDEALSRGLTIDVEALSAQLGVHVVTTVAVQKRGLDQINKHLVDARPGNTEAGLLSHLQPLTERGIPQAQAVLIIEGDEVTATKYGVPPGVLRGQIYKQRRARVNRIYEQVVTQKGVKQSLSAALGRVLLHPVPGTIIALFVCYLIFYQLLGIIVAGNVVDFTEKKAMRVYYEPLVRRLAAQVFPSEISVGDTHFLFPKGTLNAPAASFLDRRIAAIAPDEVKYNFWRYHNVSGLIGNFLVGEYGILTLTVTYLLGLLFPLVLAFYFGLSLLEDSGYLPRLAVLVDRVLNKIGLNGRAIIPLILGLGCVTMATVTTRLLTTTREKIIATALLGIAIPCSAQLGIVSGTLAKTGGALAWIVYTGIVGTMLGTTGLLLNKIMPGKSQGLLIDLPPMRLPRIDNVLKKTWTKSWNFMQESLPMFCVAGITVTAAQVTGLLDWFIHVLQPITVSWLGLPDDARIPTTFILGIVRRDFAAFGLTDVTLTTAQALVAMIVITLFVPCIATVGVMIKERGVKIAATIWIGSWVCAFFLGGLLARILPPLFAAVSF